MSPSQPHGLSSASASLTGDTISEMGPVTPRETAIFGGGFLSYFVFVPRDPEVKHVSPLYPAILPNSFSLFTEFPVEIVEV